MTETDARKLTKAERHRRRYNGENIPKLRPGPRCGYKQTTDHIEKRKRWGRDHHAWKGDAIIRKSGYSRARRQIKLFPCQNCGSSSERHHIDGNPRNNRRENVMFLCRRCHMEEDGRLDAVRKRCKEQQPRAVAARWR